MKLLGMERCGWDELGHGRNGYRKGLYFASISILYDGNPGMGACLDMSGQGCRSFEEYGTGDFDGLFRLFQQGEGYHVTSWTWPLMIIPVSWISSSFSATVTTRTGNSSL